LPPLAARTFASFKNSALAVSCFAVALAEKAVAVVLETTNLALKS